MRVTKYTTAYNGDRIPMLVKEKSSNYTQEKLLDSPKKISDMINYLFNATVLTEEHVWLIAMDNKNKPIGIFELSHGIVNGSFIGQREIFMRLYLCGATSFVVVHNHPSLDTKPSKEDVEVTRKLKECGELLGVKMLDHIIVGSDYYSFTENGF